MQITNTSFLTQTSSVANSTAKKEATEKKDIPFSSDLLALPKLELPTRESLAAEMEDFSGKIMQIFRDIGVKIPPEPVLRTDMAGNVRVAGEHPDKSRIEKAFDKETELSNQFRKLSSHQMLVHLGETHEAFSKEYARLENRPKEQEALVERRIAEGKAPVYMKIGIDGSISSFFGLSGGSLRA